MQSEGDSQDHERPERRISRREAYERYLGFSERQQAMVAALYNYLMMTNSQLGDMFSSAESRRDRGIIAGRNMEGVVKSGLAVKDLGPILGERRRTARYHLTSSGIYVCLDELGEQSTGHAVASRLKKIRKFSMSSHFRCIIDIATSLNRMKDLDVGELIDWTNDGDVTYTFNHHSGRHRLMPDGRGVWLAADGTHHPFYVELERSLRNRDHTLEKIKKYLYFSAGDNFVRYEGRYELPPVLCVVTDERLLPVVREILLAGALRAHFDIPVAAHWVTFGLATLSAVKDYKRGALVGIWESVYDGEDGLTFRELSDLAASKKRAHRH